MSQPIIRPATPADLTAVLALLDSYYAEFDIQQRDDPAYTAHALQPSTDATGYLLAFVPAPPAPHPSATGPDLPNPQQPTTNTGPTAAACVMLRALALPNIDPAIEGTAVECKRLYVLPTFRGNKLAGPLMDLAEHSARNAGHTWIYLDTNETFAAALAMYRRRGYEEVPRFNTNPQATIFMRKRL